ncbi:MAG: tetratricopeptide repeat protein [Syntrophobacteraceae bacterium]
MKRNGLFCLTASILAVGVILAYSNHFGNGFHFDDSHVIEQNINIRSLGNIPGFFTDATTFSALPANQTYRPLLTALFAVQYRAGNGGPPGFQVFSFFSHMVLWSLLFFLFQKIFTIARPSQDNRYAALFGSSFYVLHAANAETVNYISAQSDLLSTLFMSAALLLFMARPAWRKYCLYLVPAGMAMLTKESSIVFPPLLLAYILLFEKGIPLTGVLGASNRGKLKDALVMTAPSCAVCLGLTLLSLFMIPGTYTPSTTSRLEYILAQPFVIVHYFNSFLLPFGLSADTDWGPIGNPFDDRVLAGALFILILAAAALAASRKERMRPISFGLLWFFLGVLPTSSGVVPLAEVMNDHRMFLPFIGLAMAASWIVCLAAERCADLPGRGIVVKACAVVLVAAVLAGHGYGAHQRNKVWKSEESLWLDVITKNPGNARGLMNYGLSLMSRGDIRGALGYFQKALAIAPDYAYLHVNTAIALDLMGNHEAAEEHFKRALVCDRNFYGAHHYYGRFLNARNRTNEAVSFLEKAIALSPGFTESRYLLMRIHARQRNWGALSSIAADTLRVGPDDPVAKTCQLLVLSRDDPVRVQELMTLNDPTAENFLTLSLVYHQNKLYEKCIEAASQALRVKPDYAPAYNNICSAYTLLGERQKAIEACTSALEIDPGFERARNNLGLARDMN